MGPITSNVKSIKAPFLLITAPRAAASASYNRTGATNGAASAQIEELNATVVEKNLAIEGLEKERDFYFGKLRDIEVLAQECESAQLSAPEFCQKIFGVLYATEVIYLLELFILVSAFLSLFANKFTGWICRTRRGRRRPFTSRAHRRVLNQRKEDETILLHHVSHSTFVIITKFELTISCCRSF